MIDQIGIALTGVTAIALSQCSPRLQRYACIFGILGQPAWIYSAWHAQQWGILALTALYTAAWCKGLWAHWLAPAVRLFLAPRPMAEDQEVLVRIAGTRDQS